MNPRRFHVTVRSVLAAFLLMGGLQTLIQSLREPLNSGVVAVVNWIIGKSGLDSLKLRGTAMNWTYFWGELAIGLIFVMLAIGFGASALRRKSAA